MDRLSDCQQFPQERDWEYHAHRSRDGRIIKGSFNVLYKNTLIQTFLGSLYQDSNLSGLNALY